ncbi:MAG: DUF4625 domain-containing protein [Chitinophagales bacterium]|nr:DUF4625 domain-containing protein [Chitinophagales bacterium]
MNLFFYYLPLLCSVGIFLISSCDKADTEVPTIEWLSPANNSTYTTNEPLQLQLAITDDHQLFSYTLHIFSTDSTLQNAWDTTFQRGIVGQETNIDLQLQPPTAVPNGQYQIETFAIDRLDRSSDTVRINLQLRNHTDTLPPTLNISSPSTSGTVTVFSGGTLLLIGTANDNAALQDMKLYMQPTALAFNYPNHTPISYYSFSGQTTSDLVHVIAIPQQEGYYSLRIVLRDIYNNTTAKTVLLKVL